MMIKPIGYFTSEMVTGGSTGRVKTGTDAKFAPKFGEGATSSIDTKAVDSLVARAMQPSGTQTAKLESLKASVLDGTYRIDAAQTATALLADQT
jgi:anti-sigma28 factor (negative regulator of flagellin synthesis)